MPGTRSVGAPIPLSGPWPVPPFPPPLRPSETTAYNSAAWSILYRRCRCTVHVRFRNEPLIGNCVELHPRRDRQNPIPCPLTRSCSPFQTAWPLLRETSRGGSRMTVGVIAGRDVYRITAYYSKSYKEFYLVLWKLQLCIYTKRYSWTDIHSFALVIYNVLVFQISCLKNRLFTDWRNIFPCIPFHICTTKDIGKKCTNASFSSSKVSKAYHCHLLLIICLVSNRLLSHMINS